MANNRRMLKGKRDRHAKSKAQYFKGASTKNKKETSEVRPVNHQALQTVKTRVQKTKFFERCAFVLIALAIIVLVFWVFSG